MKKEILVLTIVALSIFIVTAAVAIYYSYEEDNDSGKLSYNTLIRGTDSAVSQKKSEVIISSAEWAGLWTEMFPTQQIASAIDFDNKTVVAVFAGEKPSGGYSIEIREIKELPDKIIIKVVEAYVGGECITTQALTYPYHIVEIEKINKPVEFSFVDEVLDC